VIDYQKVHDGIWKMIVQKLKHDWHRTNPYGPCLKQVDIANKTGISQRSISRYLNDHSGKTVRFIDVCKLIVSYNVNISELAESIGDKDSSKVIHTLLNQPESVKKLSSIISHSEEGWNMILSQIDFTYSQINK